jgi:peroxiredoxin
MTLIESQSSLSVGNSAPSFALKGVDGNMHSFPVGKPTLLIFMCNHCPYVKAKIDAIIGLHEKFKDRVNIIGINSNDPDYEGEGMGNMKLFAKEKNIQFPYVLDDTQEIAKAYGATCTPDPFLFDAEGRLVFHGRIDDALTLEAEPKENTMEISLEKLLNGEKIENPFQPSMGCSIKWKGEKNGGNSQD